MAGNGIVTESKHVVGAEATTAHLGILLHAAAAISCSMCASNIHTVQFAADVVLRTVDLHPYPIVLTSRELSKKSYHFSFSFADGESIGHSRQQTIVSIPYNQGEADGSSSQHDTHKAYGTLWALFPPPAIYDRR